MITARRKLPVIAWSGLSGAATGAILPVLVWLMAFSAVWAAPPAETRLIDQEPFDSLTLKQDSAVLRLQPVEAALRRPGESRPADFKLVVRLLDRPDQRYEVVWNDVERFQLFEEIVLEEAAQLVADQRFDEAYEYYLFLEERDAKFPGVADGFQRCLFLEAASWHRQEREEQALLLLNELHRRNPGYAGLDSALGLVVDKLVESHLAAGRYAAARKLLGDLAVKFPGQAIIQQRRQQLIDQASQALATARTAREGGDFRQASTAASQAVAAWPELPEARELLEDLHRRFPVVTVAVRQFAADDHPAHFPSWAALRQNRLTSRALVEPSSYGPTGMQYASPVGTWAIDEATITFTIDQRARWPGGQGAVTSTDVVRLLLEAARPENREFRGDGARVMRSVRTDGANRVVVQCAAAGEAALGGMQVPLEPWATIATTSKGPLGAYRVSSRGDGELRFEAIADSFLARPGQPAEIVERRLSTIGAIVEALRSGEIVACDRVAPWDVDRLARYEGIAVHAYAAPTVHLLVPNLHKPLTAQREFRRALLYGLDRQRILRDDLLKTEDPARGHVLDGPFRTHDAAEEGAAPRTYDRRMMVALVRAAAAREIGNESAVDLAQTLPSVTLAYVPSETARVACRAIKQQLELDGRGIPVELVEVTAHDALADRSRWDLLYVEWPAFDSLADAARLLGSEGLVQGGSPWLEDLLGQLASAGSVDDARDTLQRIDRLVGEELTVIPLFQITEHFAYRTSLEGIEDGTVTLYQNVESWRHPPVVPK